MYGEPALPQDFVALPYANPEAPRGGRVVLGNTGSFDSLNPYIRKGSVPWQLRFLTHESLMGRNWDEPFALYGLLAESVETPEDRSWVEFTLRPEARFSDGSPVTVEDVIWSYDVLGREGHPRYLGFASQIESVTSPGPGKVRITFNTEDRELALIAGLRPILKKAQWEGKSFADAPLQEVPIGSAPYVIDDYEAGRQVTLRRDPDYWGAELPFRRGTNNFDEIRIEFFGDETVMFEAFKAGELSFYREGNAEKWDQQYDFPAVQSGEVVKSEIRHQRPTGMTGLVMNSRRAPFDDWRVREALIRAFNFPFINGTVTGGRQPRITSYFANSGLAMQPGPAEGQVRELLAPFAADLPPGTLEGYDLPAGDASVRNRRDIRAAMQSLNEAGWTAGDDGMLRNAEGEPFTFEVLLRQGDRLNQSIIEIYRSALDRLGIRVEVVSVDPAQYAEREAKYDFDMTSFRRDLSLSPGNEQRFYWGSEGGETPGSRNLMGMASPAADALIDAMLNAPDQEGFVAATRALDRVLTAGRYVIPIWYGDRDMIAHKRELRFPESVPIYGDRIGWFPDVWWYEE